MKEITSTANPLVKAIKKLHDSRVRKESGVCIVEGWRACEEFFHSSYQLEHLIVTEHEYDAAVAAVPFENILLVSEQVMQAISQATTPSGVLGIFKIPATALPKRLLPGLVLAQIQDPGNMGTLIRTAVACKVPAVYIVEGTDPFSHKVIQASAGTIAQAPLFIISWHDLLQKKDTLALSALVVKGGQPPLKVPLKEQLMIVGNEAHGLPASWQKKCDELITLPMPGGTESLNAAVAGSIAVYLAYVENQKK